jgi:hypothetical protein
MRRLLLTALVLAGLVLAAPAAAGASKLYPVALDGNFGYVSNTANVFKDVGLISGSPFREADIFLTLQLKPGGVATERFRIVSANGTVWGTVTGTYTISDRHVNIVGTAKFTRGTGIYKGIRADNLAFTETDTVPPSGGPLTFSGLARY